MNHRTVAVAAGVAVLAIAGASLFYLNRNEFCFPAADISRLVGSWTSSRDKDGSYERVVVTKRGADVLIADGTCSGRACDTGAPVPAQPCTWIPLGARARSLVASFDLGYATDHVALRDDGDDGAIMVRRLQWIIQDGGPGLRPDIYSDRYLVRGSAVAHSEN